MRHRQFAIAALATASLLLSQLVPAAMLAAAPNVRLVSPANIVIDEIGQRLGHARK